MNVRLPFNFSLSVMQLMRQCGYHPNHNFNEKENYVRRLTAGLYPRFHVYIGQEDNLPLLKLHLDQKKPAYPGAHAHNAEYDGEVVENEIQRIQNIIKQA